MNESIASSHTELCYGTRGLCLNDDSRFSNSKDNNNYRSSTNLNEVNSIARASLQGLLHPSVLKNGGQNNWTNKGVNNTAQNNLMTSPNPGRSSHTGNTNAPRFSYPLTANRTSNLNQILTPPRNFGTPGPSYTKSTGEIQRTPDTEMRARHTLGNTPLEKPVLARNTANSITNAKYSSASSSSNFTTSSAKPNVVSASGSRPSILVDNAGNLPQPHVDRCHSVRGGSEIILPRDGEDLFGEFSPNNQRNKLSKRTEINPRGKILDYRGFGAGSPDEKKPSMKTSNIFKNYNRAEIDSPTGKRNISISSRDLSVKSSKKKKTKKNKKSSDRDSSPPSHPSTAHQATSSNNMNFNSAPYYIVDPASINSATNVNQMFASQAQHANIPQQQSAPADYSKPYYIVSYDNSNSTTAPPQPQNPYVGQTFSAPAMGQQNYPQLGLQSQYPRVPIQPYGMSMPHQVPFHGNNNNFNGYTQQDENRFRPPRTEFMNETTGPVGLSEENFDPRIVGYSANLGRHGSDNEFDNNHNPRNKRKSIFTDIDQDDDRYFISDNSMDSWGRRKSKRGSIFQLGRLGRKMEEKKQKKYNDGWSDLEDSPLARKKNKKHNEKSAKKNRNSRSAKGRRSSKAPKGRNTARVSLWNSDSDSDSSKSAGVLESLAGFFFGDKKKSKKYDNSRKTSKNKKSGNLLPWEKDNDDNFSDADLMIGLNDLSLSPESRKTVNDHLMKEELKMGKKNMKNKGKYGKAAKKGRQLHSEDENIASDDFENLNSKSNRNFYGVTRAVDERGSSAEELEDILRSNNREKYNKKRPLQKKPKTKKNMPLRDDFNSAGFSDDEDYNDDRIQKKRQRSEPKHKKMQKNRVQTPPLSSIHSEEDDESLPERGRSGRNADRKRNRLEKYEQRTIPNKKNKYNAKKRPIPKINDSGFAGRVRKEQKRFSEREEESSD